jgi:hypothetical protein
MNCSSVALKGGFSTFVNIKKRKKVKNKDEREWYYKEIIFL